tara:strand:+ start:10131 stop:12311 length:2181 start_codon:yes stop_codon:yes gene_type:complete
LSISYAQNRKISGFVYSRQTNSSIENVNVFISGESIGASSAIDGSFYLDNIPDARFELSLSIIGYQDTVITIESMDSQINLGRLYLNLSVLDFEEINVAAHPELGNAQSLSNISLSGSAIQEKTKGTLAATLENETGVATTSMGQATARPILRGYGGDRFLLTDSGLELGDLSQTSGDHAVSIDMSSAQSVNIIRGAKALLYGSNTIAGVIDIKKNSLPELQFDRPHLHGVLGGATGDNSSFTNTVYHYPFKNNQVTVSALLRNTKEQMTPKGVLKNTSSFNNGFFAGLANYNSRGRTNISLESLTMDYGIPGSPEGHIDGVDIEMEKITQKFEYHRDIEFFPNLKTFDFEQRFIKYEHQEYEAKKSFAAVDLGQQIFSLQGRLTGTDRSIGSLIQYRKFIAGGFYWTPNTDEINLSLFGFREKEFNGITIQASSRFEFLAVKPEISNFSSVNIVQEQIKERNFYYGSYALGVFKNWQNWKMSSNVMLLQRAPGIEDLFSDGPHLGSYSYEIGEPNLGLELTQGIEASLSYQKNRLASTLTAYSNYSPNFHLSSKIGDGYVPGSDWIEWGSGSSGWLYKYKMRGLKTRIYGIEFDINYKADYVMISVDYSTVIGNNISEGIPLPYIPPSKSRIKFIFEEIKNFTPTLQITQAFSQNRLGEFEQPTNGYTLIDLFGSYDLNVGNGSHKIIFQFNNILDEIHYNHLSKIKTIMPEMGRSVSIQYRFLF